MKSALLIAVFLSSGNLSGQICDCEKEFLYTKSVVENNFAGFHDKVETISQTSYNQKVKQLLKLTHNKFASDNCILIISEYLDQFKSHHLGFRPRFDVYKTDTAFVNQRPIFKIKN